MALLVVPAVGAESYISVETADAFHASRGNTAWATIPALRKEELLRQATDYLEARYAGLWVGSPVVTGQGLQWPRINYVPGVLLVDPLLVPTGVAKATAQLALEAHTTPLIDESTESSQQVVSEKVGPISVTYSEKQGSSTKNRHILAEMYLAPWLRSSTGQSLLVRG
jgi:hypothetical protein